MLLNSLGYKSGKLYYIVITTSKELDDNKSYIIEYYYDFSKNIFVSQVDILLNHESKDLLDLYKDDNLLTSVHDKAKKIYNNISDKVDSGDISYFKELLKLEDGYSVESVDLIIIELNYEHNKLSSKIFPKYVVTTIDDKSYKFANLHDAYIFANGIIHRLKSITAI